jgi:quercetin dioxygenase-like cupin family protein
MKKFIYTLIILVFLYLSSCCYNYKESGNRTFMKSDEVKWENAGEGVNRQVLGYDKRIMLVRVDFREKAVGAAHKHKHSQSSLILKGEFEVTIDGKTQTLKEGDAFFVPSGKDHGALCIKEGSILDAFSPAREDFLTRK